jgi:hypothetical protein
MTRKFEETVRKVADRIGRGHVILTERVRTGKRRKISVGPYRTATGPRQYALCVLPAISGHNDCTYSPGSNKTAREFVRLVGVDEAHNALVRESRKREGLGRGHCNAWESDQRRLDQCKAALKRCKTGKRG